MGTLPDSLDALGAEASQGPEARAKPRPMNAVIVGSPLSYMALGTLIAVARECTDFVFVVMGGEDPRIGGLARSLGAVVVNVHEGEGCLIDSILSRAGVVVAMKGDGSHDPRLISGLIARAEKSPGVITGYSPVAGEKPASAGEGELVAFSTATLCGFKAVAGQDLSRQVLEHARQSGVSVASIASDPDQSLLKMYRIGVVVPAYNEELLLGETVSGIPAYVSRIYVVDDCSTDRTPEIIKRLNDPRVVSLRHEVNEGVGASILDGYRLALAEEMDVVAVMAGDNQMDPAQLPRLLMPVIEGRADYAKGNRLVNKEYRKGMSSWRSLGNFLLTVITKIGSGYWNVMDTQNGYTVISRQALQKLDLDSVYTYYGYCNDLLIKLNARGMAVLDVAIPARYGRERSKIRYGRFIRKVAPMIFRGFLWRLKVKYVVPDFHPLILFYVTGMVLAPMGLVSFVLSQAAMLAGLSLDATYVALAVIVLLAGLQSLFTGMLLDRQATLSRKRKVI